MWQSFFTIPNRIKIKQAWFCQCCQKKNNLPYTVLKFIFLSFSFGSRNLCFQNLAFSMNFVSDDQGNNLIAVSLPHAMLIPILAELDFQCLSFHWTREPIPDSFHFLDCCFVACCLLPVPTSLTITVHDCKCLTSTNIIPKGTHWGFHRNHRKQESTVLKMSRKKRQPEMLEKIHK